MLGFLKKKESKDVSVPQADGAHPPPSKSSSTLQNAKTSRLKPGGSNAVASKGSNARKTPQVNIKQPPPVSKPTITGTGTNANVAQVPNEPPISMPPSTNVAPPNKKKDVFILPQTLKKSQAWGGSSMWNVMNKSQNAKPTEKQMQVERAKTLPAQGSRRNIIRERLDALVREVQDSNQTAFKKRTAEAFAAFDVNEDGSIDLDELKAVIEHLAHSFQIPVPSDNLIIELFEKFDVEGDGKFAKEEFEQFFKYILCHFRDLNYAPRLWFRREIFIRKKTGRIEESYLFQNKLGQGQFGIVHKVIEKVSGSVRCCKTINKKKAHVPAEQIENEMDIIKRLDHPHIVRLFECYEDYNNIYMIFELCQGQELLALLLNKCRSGNTFSENDAAKLMHSILSAVSHCHTNRIMHKDLKPENIIINWHSSRDKKDKTTFTLKIIDFGLAEMFVPGTMSASSAGTPYYMAPEVFSRHFNYKCDVWSCGVMMYLVLTGHLPFDAPNKEAYAKVVREQHVSFPSELFKHISKDAIDLIQLMLKKDWTQRPMAAAILSHPWFTNKVMGSSGKLALSPNIFGTDQFSSFTEKSSLQRVCMNLVAMHLQYQDVQKAPDVFKGIDQNGDGFLSPAELKAGLSQLGVPASEVNSVIEAMDADGSGMVSYTEFVASLVQVGSEEFEQNLWNAFRQFDLNGDGTITADEFRALLMLPEQKETICGIQGSSPDDFDVDKIIDEIDTDKDGVVNFDEFCNYVHK